MDALSDLLRVVKLTGGVFLDAEFTSPWCVMSQVGPEDFHPAQSAPAHIIAFHYVVAGELQLQVDDDPPLAVRSGEIVMLPRNDAHRLGSAVDLPAVSGDQLVPTHREGELAQIRYGGGGEPTHIICGYLGSEARHNPLVDTLPKMLNLAVREGPAGEWVESSFRYAAREVAAGHAGSETVLAKLSELLFVQAVRRYVETLPPERKGWLAGLRDPAVGRALALIHGRLAHPWTAEELAGEVFLSRSAFADRFTVLIGMPPMRYVAMWRMQVAAQRLREGHRSVAQVAFDVGYESEAAFNRAFKREFGTGPGAWRRGGT